jgi:hypothetical protein
MTDFAGVIRTLVNAGVDFIIVGRRPRDLEAVAELEALREERGRH